MAASIRRRHTDTRPDVGRMIFMADTFTREYSKRLGVLTGEQLQKALDRFNLGTLIAAEPVPVGLFGQNVFLNTDKGSYVLRACPHGREQFPREQFFANMLHEHTAAPAPWPYYHEPECTVFPYPFALLPRLPGDCLAFEDRLSKMTAAEHLPVAAALGAMLAEMHRLTWPIAGSFDFDTRTIVPLPPSDEPLAQIEKQMAQMQDLAVLPTADDLAKINSVVTAARDALTEPFTPTYVHHDYREGNSTLTQSATGWKVSGVFDLMEGYFRRPEEDFARYICSHAGSRPGSVKAFVAAYRAARPLTVGWQARVRLYALIDQFLLWTYGQHHGWYDDKAKLAHFLDPVVQVALE